MGKPQPVWIHNLIFYANEKNHVNHLGYPSRWYQIYITRKIEQLESRIMAKKNAQSQSNRSWTETKFVTIRLGGEHKDKFREYMQRDAEKVALDVASFMSNGHKTSITWDDNNTCWIVASTCKEESSKNLDCCISSRSSEWYEALCMNVYKNDIVCKGGSWIDHQETTDWG